MNHHPRHRSLTEAPTSTRTALWRRRAAVLLSGLAFTLAPGVAPAAATTQVEAGTPRGESACETGEFCVWPEAGYGGAIARLDLRNTNPEECRPLPDGMTARSFSNLIDRHVTVYQDAQCSTEADFSTYPGPGTFVPRSPYVVRAVQIWN